MALHDFGHYSVRVPFRININNAVKFLVKRQFTSAVMNTCN